MSANPNQSFDDFNKQASSNFNSFLAIVVVLSVVSIAGSVAIVYLVYRCVKKNGLPAVNINTNPTAAAAMYAVVPDSQIRDATVERFLKEIAGEKPIRFTAQQLAGFTNNYSARLGAGGFGTVYKGMLPNGLTVAVKRLHVGGHGDGWSTSQEQFMAEVGSVGRIHHINLVRLFGFCFDADVRALVYEYMDNGALDAYLFDRSRAVPVATRRAIAVGVARGLRYLHEECQHKIVHYDIKPGNVLLDGGLTPKVADFGLARLASRGDTHVSVSGMRGTPGYAAPEMWMQAGVTEKCDVYSFGVHLFEIVRRRRNLDDGGEPGSQHQWFPMLAWSKHEAGHLAEAIEGCDAMDKQERETVERMCKVAFWCVQQQPEARPPMSAVVRMLEGEVDIDAPPVNPFQHLVASPAAALRWTSTTDSAESDNSLRSGSRQSAEVIIPIGSLHC
ncbi:G-type lectin S-receptor-like serine/threonine-protein kinase SD2-5 [Oryza sativa Japonica Group]|uniref:S-receptor kinase PK3-like protein n=3 Tax=Oryza sativa TaxID=4530 RepID=Q7F169_ORYSJ|nr:G-type lectin S-receptor-like serine/threonine-protein kinase SD2-5 [Oryza sativa Japonica Group]EAZ02730.1 hypothetical protein OsI_24848 [Oryza sativa Indica Group]EAZ36440.1 hypothetical protein OsJ_20772 [Oryza sativa Japonica Group]KAF2921381.1 hypothetical protein DAI22_07g028900 [Oryza sativa Japonica Group]BAC83282.1 S-receptor kinase PK3 precursor-like protein [Oryza sativa Japonica Group]